jgi:hypothetical protein
MGEVSTVRVFPHKDALKCLLERGGGHKQAFVDIFGEKRCASVAGDESDVDQMLQSLCNQNSCYAALAKIDDFFGQERQVSEVHWWVGVAAVLLLADILLCKVLPYEDVAQYPVVVEGAVLLDASLVAAQKIRRGLSFELGNPEPANVFFCDYLPPDEFGHEQGASKLRAEIWARFYRAESTSLMSPGRFRQAAAKFLETVGGLVVALNVDYRFDCRGVDVVLNELGIGLFLWDKKDCQGDVAEALGDLKSAIELVLKSGKKFSSRVLDMKKENEQNSVVNHVTVNVNGGSLGQGGVQVAGQINNNIGIPADKFLRDVTESLSYLRGELERLGDSQEKKDILEDLKEVEKATAAGGAEKNDVKYLERTLRGMERAANAMEAGEKVLEGVKKLGGVLAPVLAAFGVS